MRKRDNIIEKFSTFLLVEDRNKFTKVYWQQDSKLKKNMEKMVALNPNASENFFAEYWLARLQPSAYRPAYRQFFFVENLLERSSLYIDNGLDIDNGLARLHLSAYLEEACYYSVSGVFRQYAAEDLSWMDFFQIARQAAATPEKVLKNYDSNRRNSTIEIYAKLKLKSAILDYIRRGPGRDLNKYSDGGLLRILSKKALTQALQKAGIYEPYLSRYLLAWEAFQQIYSPIATRANFQLPPPTSKQWADMAAYYNERLVPRHQEEAVSSSDIQNWLKFCINAVRESEKVKFYSIDVDNSNLKLSLARKSQEQHIDLDEQVDVSEQWQQLKTVLTEALAGLPNEAQKMLLLKYGVELTQIEIAKMFGFEQYQVSRKLSRYKLRLLEVLALWSQRHAQIEIEVGVEKINELSSSLDGWLISYYQELIIHKLRQAGILQDLKEQTPFLYHYYSRNLPVDELRLQLKISESDIDEKLAKEKQYLQVILQTWVQNTLEVPANYVNSVAESIATCVKRFLPNAPSSIFQIEKR